MSDDDPPVLIARDVWRRDSGEIVAALDTDVRSGLSAAEAAGE